MLLKHSRQNIDYFDLLLTADSNDQGIYQKLVAITRGVPAPP